MKYYKNYYTWLPVDAIKLRELTVSMNRESLPYYFKSNKVCAEITKHWRQNI